ncbi:MAG TPA: YjjG family noncanonical pyrimidine nucleotidase [Oscillospiraceae bacterium]|nr:YjjG family noncanonical pyrimidine nucleotidase [Oscillospiraceae bacterium]
MSNFDLILFDADNTLFDFNKAQEHALKTAIASTLEKYHIPYSDEILHKYEKINQDLWDKYELGFVTKDQLQVKRFSDLFDILHVEEDAVHFNTQYMTALSKGSCLLDGAQELCETLSRSCKLALVTNGVSKTQHKRFENSTIKDYFTDIFVSEDAGFQKPRKEYFDYVFEHLGTIEKERMIIVGDSLSSDMKGGNNAGITTCWFNPHSLSNNSDAVCDYEVHKLSEVIPIVLA